LRYLKSRKVGKAEVEQFNIHYTPDNSSEAGGRIIFPVYQDRVLVSWIGRDYTGRNKLRYYNCPDKDSTMRLSHLLYGPLDIGKEKILRVVEGVFDKIIIGASSVAVFKNRVSKRQIRLIKNLNPKEVYFIFDDGSYGNALLAAEELSPFIDKIKIVRLKGKKDPADLGLEKLMEIEKNVPYYIF
jgi:DNA primase